MHMTKFSLVVLAFCTVVSLVLGADNSASWSYDLNAPDGPEHWPGICSSGKRQSPIDIKTDETEYDSALGAFTLTSYNAKPSENFTSINTKTTLKISFDPYFYNVSGGGLTGTYTTVQFHLHWGTTNSKGSEHALNEKFYPAEIHFVSYNVKYSSLTAALAHADGLAVLGVFIKIGSKNEQYEKFLNDMGVLPVDAGSNTTIPSFEFLKLLPSNLTKFYRYDGSLTTPTCNEAVTWTVFADAVEISQKQMDLLRSLKMNATTPITDNYRPPQSLGNRVVKDSFMPSPPSTANRIALQISSAVLLSLFGAIFLL